MLVLAQAHAAYQTGNANGQAASANSAPVVISNDQPAVNTVTPIITSPSTTYNFTSTGNVCLTGVTPGAWYSLCIQMPTITAANTTIAASNTTTSSQIVVCANTTNAQLGQQVTGAGIVKSTFITAINANTNYTISEPATATASVTLNNTANQLVATWQSSPDNTTWSNMTVIPRSTTFNNAPVSTVYNPGLWLVQAPQNVKYMRLNIGTLTNCTINAYIDPWVVGARVNLPYMTTATQANWPTGAAFIPVFDTSYLADIGLDLGTFTGTGQTITPYQSNDPALVTPLACPAITTSATTFSPVTTMTATGYFVFQPKSKYFTATETGTAITAFIMQGLSGRVSLTDSTPLTSTLPAANVTQWGGTAAATQKPNTNQGISVGYLSPSNNAEKAVSNISASGNTGTITDDSGAVISGLITLAAVTNTSASIDLGLQSSYDNGTTWQDIFHVARQSTNTTIAVPPITVDGRRRWFWNTNGTGNWNVTISTMRCIGNFPVYHNYYDRTAALINASATGAGTSFLIAGCKTVTMFMDCGAATTGGTYQLQISPDGSKWSTVGTVQAVASSTVSINASMFSAQFVRANCSVTGSGQTGNYIAFNATN